VILQDAFTVEPWNLRETHLDLDLLAQTESVFALANGHVGWRANLDEGEPHGLPGSYLNGVYESRQTVRDSSLSACTQAAIAAETGHLDLAFDYLGEAALMDLHDLEHNTRDGVHIASLAGTWVALVGGFGGLRDTDGTFSFTPRLPEPLTRLAFTLFIRGRRLRVEITHARYVLADGDPLDIVHHGQPVSLSAAKPQIRPIPPASPRPRPSQPPGREPVHRQPTVPANQQSAVSKKADTGEWRDDAARQKRAPAPGSGRRRRGRGGFSSS
jgi:trehalose/maltose hydrolase-like predicted phosphorylase